MIPSPDSSATQILFVCVGNSCRSQMAEAFARHLGGEKVRAFSAGSHPLGRIIAETYRSMREKGISLDGQWSKGLDEVPAGEIDVLVTMGCEVACPVPAGFKGQIVEWNIPDPFLEGAKGFAAVRDLIEEHVRQLLDDIRRASDRSGPSRQDAQTLGPGEAPLPRVEGQKDLGRERQG